MKTLATGTGEAGKSASRGSTITVSVNGERREIPAGSTVGSLLALLDIEPRLVVVEHNREIVRELAARDARALRHGDSLEIVHFVGGG